MHAAVEWDAIATGVLASGAGRAALRAQSGSV
jgi:hypothetical protein